MYKHGMTLEQIQEAIKRNTPSTVIEKEVHVAAGLTENQANYVNKVVAAAIRAVMTGVAKTISENNGFTPEEKA